jgi:hypothetical protein
MKRSFAVTLVYIMVLITITSNIVRIWTVLAWSEVLTEFSARLSPPVSAIIGTLWIAVSCILYLGISQRKAWAWKMLLGTAAGYTIGYWSERLFFQNPRPNTVFAVIVNLVLMIVIYFAIKSLSREAYERKIENPVIE